MSVHRSAPSSPPPLLRLLYKPWSLLFGIAGGLMAGKLFTVVWGLFGSKDVPEPTRRDSSWGVLLPAAALEGAIYAGVKAATQRASAQAFERSTGIWPGEQN